jgi:hypothetical protein
MKFPFFILIHLFAFSFSVYSQTLIFEDSTGLKRGIYKNFSEFKFNRPSINYEFTIEEGVQNYGPKRDSLGHKVYYLVLSEPSLNNDSVWGFCDGKNIYINNVYFFKPKSRFDKIEYMGRYCYFTRWFATNSYSRTRRDLMRGSTFPHIKKMLININTGRSYHISEIIMTDVLSRDNVLYSQYSEEREIGECYFKYLKLYSEKHKEEIKR